MCTIYVAHLGVAATATLVAALLDDPDVYIAMAAVAILSEVLMYPFELLLVEEASPSQMDLICDAYVSYGSNILT